MVVRSRSATTLLEDHLNGVRRIAVCPILSDGHSAQFGVVDIDIYNIELDTLQKTIAYSLPSALSGALQPYQTKSGGWHLFLSLTAMVEAGDLKKLLGKIQSWLPYSNDKIDIRPDQATIKISDGDRGTMGSYITLPLYNTSEAEAQVWMDELESKRVAPEVISASMDEGDFADGPPCLFPLQQEGEASGDWANRNHYIYQLSVFYQKKYPADWQERVRKYAEDHITPALEPRSVDGTIASVERNKPRYICTRGGFPRVCNKALCSSRKHGVTSGDAAETLIRGKLSVIDADPKVWFLTIAGKDGEDVRMTLTTGQLQTVTQFRKRCLEEMKYLPQLPAQKQWESYINVLLETVTVIPVPKDMTPEAELLSHIYKFYLTTPVSSNAEDLLRGSIYSYSEMVGAKAESHMVFTLLDLKNYLKRSRAVSPSDNLYSKLKQLEMMVDMVKIKTAVHEITGAEINVWDVVIPPTLINQREVTSQELTQ